MVIVENLKPAAVFPENTKIWFSVVPDSIRTAAIDFVTSWSQASNHNAPFFLTRAITGACFLSLAIWWAWLASRQSDSRIVCKYAFLTLAWFWLLCPTQNPWYWMWALPFLPFAQSRAWLAMSGLVMVYYLRFWFEYHAGTPVLGTKYAGTAFFDFVVTWLEFAPWFICLGLTSLIKSNGSKRDENDSKM